MVAPKKNKRIVCTVIRLPENPMSAKNRLSDTGGVRPSELLPWADPMIAKLVSRLQNEVRSERDSKGPLLKPLDPKVSFGITSELEPVTPSFDTDYEFNDEPRFNWDERTTEQVGR
ncbi:MAG: hypothetical protein RH917_08755 [Lacipirellulaceae bacterium]